MIAIISQTQRGDGAMIQVLGAGATEQAARIAAQDYMLGGKNINEDELQGGIRVHISEKLAALYRDPQWVDNVDEEGRLVGSECTDAHMQLLNALGRLYIDEDGKLNFHEAPKNMPAKAPAPLFSGEEWDDSEAYDYN